MGQFVLYRSLLKRVDSERTLFLAVSDEAFRFHLDTAEGRDLIADENLKVMVFLPDVEEIERWIE